jgi:hypothetical protein
MVDLYLEYFVRYCPLSERFLYQLIITALPGNNAHIYLGSVTYYKEGTR